MMVTLKQHITVKTSGSGLWSNQSKEVKITKIDWYDTTPEGDDEREYQVDVYFDHETWDIARDGLIYTDPAFKSDLREKILELVGKGELPATLPWEKLAYTEQGMQGDNFVHMILGDW